MDGGTIFPELGSLSFLTSCGVAAVSDCRVCSIIWVKEKPYLEVQAQSLGSMGQYKEGAGGAPFIFNPHRWGIESQEAC